MKWKIAIANIKVGSNYVFFSCSKSLLLMWMAKRHDYLYKGQWKGFEFSFSSTPNQGLLCLSACIREIQGWQILPFDLREGLEETGFPWSQGLVFSCSGCVDHKLSYQVHLCLGKALVTPGLSPDNLHRETRTSLMQGQYVCKLFRSVDM